MRLLIITPYFPSPDIYSDPADDPRTKFLLRYAVEWVGNGLDVTVLHLPLRYISFFDSAARALSAIKYGAKFRRFIQNKTAFTKNRYSFSGVKVIRIPLLKFWPRQKRFTFLLNKVLVESVCDNGEDFDFILSDFLSPSIDAALYLKKHNFKNAAVWQVFHQSDLIYYKKNPRYYSVRLNQVNGYLFRSKPSMQDFIFDQKIPHRPSSMIYSGVPGIQKAPSNRSSVRNFIYVGALRFSKNVHHTIESFARCFRGTCCTLVIVGDGPDREELESLVRSLAITRQVRFTGKLSRPEVFQEMSEADCLVMVSPETFGMVYVEAMAHGCVVVAALNQGIDGVVESGRNGYLVNLNMPAELDELITRLSRSSSYEIERVTKAAIETAELMSDTILAEKVFKDIKTLSEA